MNALTDAKAAHLKAADERWEDAVQQYRETLAHHIPEVGQLAHRMLTVRTHTRWSAFGGPQQGFSFPMYSFGEQIPYDPCALLEFVRHFAGYLIGKHSEPGVAYYRYAHENDDPSGETFALCDKDHPQAMPYFHRSWEELCKANPEAERATAERALEVLGWYEARAGEHRDEVHADIKDGGGYWNKGDLEEYPTKEEALLFALADEISALGLES